MTNRKWAACAVLCMCLVLACESGAPTASPAPHTVGPGSVAQSPLASTPPPPAVTARPSSPATIMPTATVSPTATADLHPSAFDAEVMQRISPQFAAQVAIALDTAGRVHVVGGTNDGLAYLTNRGGSWDETVIMARPRDGDIGEPSVTVDGDGTVWVAFTRVRDGICRFGCDGGDIIVMSNGPSGWSVHEFPGTWSMPAIAVRDGTAHLAVHGWTRSVGNYVQYASLWAGTWQQIRVAERASVPTIHLTSEGSVVVGMAMESGSEDVEFGFAIKRASAEVFELHSGPVLPWGWPPADSALDSHDQLHIVGPLGHQALVDGVWTSVAPTFGGLVLSEGTIPLRPGALSVGADGGIHVVSANDFVTDGGGIWYSLDRGSGFVTSTLLPYAAWGSEDGPSGSSDIAVDGEGRPHLVFNVLRDDPGQEGIWYATGRGV